MTMELLRPIQIIKEFDCSDVPATPSAIGGEPFYTGTFSSLQVREFPHAYQSLHVRSDDGAVDFALQPDPGQVIEVPEKSYQIRTSWRTALLSSWRASLLIGSPRFYNPWYGNSGQVYPAFRNKIVAGGASAYYAFIPKQSGFIRYIPAADLTGFTAYLKRFCKTSGALQHTHAGTPLSVYELSGTTSPTTHVVAVGYVTAGIKYEIQVRNATGAPLTFSLDVSTEKR